MFDSIAETYDPTQPYSLIWYRQDMAQEGIAFLRPFSLKRYWISLPVPETWLSPCTKAATRPYRRCRHLVRHDGSGTEKVAAAGYSEYISFEQQDCTALTYEENSFDAVTAAFGVRNFENIEQGISGDVPGAETRWAYHDLGTFHTGTFSHETTLPDQFKDRHPLYRTSTL